MEIKTFYNNRYETINSGIKFSNWQEFTLRDIKKESLVNKSIMEILVGPNGLIYYFNQKKGQNKLFGVDLDKNVLKHLEENGIKSLNIDISNNVLPIEDGTIDIIIFNEVIEHLFDCQHALNEIYRVLKKNGNLYISTHNSFNFYMRLKYLLGIIPTPSLDVSHETMGEHIRLFNKKLLVKLLKRAGFQNKNIIDRSRFKLGKFSFHTHIFTSILSRHLYFIAKK